MKRKILITFLTILTIIFSSFAYACSFSGGNDEPEREISSKLLTLMDGTFSSAEYVVAGESGGKSSKMASAENLSLCALSFTEPEYSSKLEELTRLFYGTGGGVPLTENNIKALKGEALANGSTFASMARALAEVYGDNVFSECYSFQNVSFKITGNNDDFTINGVLYEDNKYRSGFQMRLKKEKDDTYSYNYVEYTISTHYNSSKVVTSTLLKISSFSKDGILNTQLTSENLSDFSSYDKSYDKFTLEKMTVANFNIDNYASVTFDHNTPSTLEQVESAMKFSKEVLGNSVETYNYLKGIKSTKSMSKEDALKISSIVNNTYYVCPYYYENNKTYVREEYVVPNNVTVIKTGSIPATKTIYIHGNVTKIESRPFQQPEYLENIVFTDPTSNKLTEIGSFDYSTGEPSFILSMTKVKNFTLPASVKKLELGLYILNTEVECLDLSAYNPTFITDSSQFTYKMSDEDEKHGDYIKADYRNSAYVKLRLGGTTEFPYKELRYIETLKMPKFNMGVDIKDTSHYSVKDSSGVEYYSEAHRVVTDVLKYSEITEEEFFENNNYTETYECIGKIYFNEQNTIVSEDLLYSDISDKEDRREEFDIELYDTSFQVDTYSTVKYIYVNAEDYFTASTIEQQQANRMGLSNLINDRVQIIISGASGLSFEGFNIDKVYLENGEKVDISSLKAGNKFYAPNVEGTDSIKKEGSLTKYFAGWSYTQNGNVDVHPFKLISNNMQTLYPVFLQADTAFDYEMNDDGSYKAIYNKTGNGKILVVPSEYNGVKVKEFACGDSSSYREVDIIIFAHGIERIDYSAIRKVMPDTSIFPTTAKEVMGVYFDESVAPLYKNAFYQPIGSNPFGLFAEIDDNDSNICSIHEDAIIIGYDAFSGVEIENVTIPSKVKVISASAFDFSPIKSIIIPSSVEIIGDCAFLDCDNLESVEIKDGLKFIGTQAFDGCDNLKTVKLPKTLETLGSDVFDNCPNIQGNVYNNGVYLGAGNNNYFALVNIVDTEVESFTVHDSTVFLSFDLEYGCSANKIYIGKNVKEITTNIVFDFNSDLIVYYTGSQSDWNNIVFAGYEFLTDWQGLKNNPTYKNYAEDIEIVFNS